MSHDNPSIPRTAPPPYNPNPGHNPWSEASETTPLNREADDGTARVGYAAVHIPKRSILARHPTLKFTVILICVAIVAVYFDYCHVRALARLGIEAERQGWRRERETWKLEQANHDHDKKRILADWDREQTTHELEHRRTLEQWSRERVAWKLEQADHDRDRRRALEEWDRERTARELEHRRTLDQWIRERNTFLAEWKSENEERERQRQLFREGWDREREEREQERRAFDRERAGWDRQREERKPFWDPPVVDSPQCIAYNTRRYKSRLWNVPLGGDWLEACMYTPIKIHDRQITHPEKCDIVGRDIIYGYFRVDFDEMDCQPTWDKPWDHGCVGGGIHVLEATLLGLKSGQDSYEMCRTTPGNIPGIPGDLGHPVKCENKGVFGGKMVGRWEFYDPKCN